jgi:CRISPR-associated Csx2 family protein
MWDNLASTFDSDEEYQLKLIDKKEENTVDKNDLLQLEKDIDKYLNHSGSHCIIVNDGETKDELWDIFNMFLEILEDLDENDEIYFDITHLFRSLSVMAFIMAEFGKTSKKFKISKFLYGKLKNESPSPIIDLSMFFELLDWSKAIENLKKYGNSSDLKNLISNSDFSSDLENSFSNFSNALSISDMGAMQGAIKVLKGKLKSFDSNQNPIVNIISKDLRVFINRFSIDSLWKFQLELSKWYLENKNYAMSYMALAEAIITKACEIKGYNIKSKEGREAGKDYIKITKYDDDFSPKYPNGISQIRNNIAHQLDTRGGGVDNDIKKLSYFIDRFEPFFKQ